MKDRRAEFRRALEAGALVADGAMGTQLLARLGVGRISSGPGLCPGRCLDELNLSRPELVGEVHREYVVAGAQILGTNTFGASRARLDAFGLAGKVPEMNRAGVRIAREAADAAATDERVFVAGIVGPSGRSAREQIEVLVEGGVDLLLLETFQQPEELLTAIQDSREVAGTGMVVVAQVSVEEVSATEVSATEVSVAEMGMLAKWLDESAADVIGVNCSFGPRAVLEAIQAMRALTSKPLSAMPNAGLPEIAPDDGRCIYPVSPDLMAEYAGHFLRAGVRIVGGCCGTRPEHIRGIREVFHAGNGPKGHASATLTKWRPT